MYHPRRSHKVQESVKDWDAYNDTAKKMKDAGYKMTASANDTYRVYSNNVSSKWVEDGKVQVDDNIMKWVDDSKKLSEKKREKLFDKILSKAIACGIGMCDNNIIDDINILNATKRAMTEAVENADKVLRGKTGSGIDHLLIDALRLEAVDIPQTGIIKGDAKSISIAAASIVAKVTRERMMQDYAKEYPYYAFESNKGYGTRAHYDGIAKYGITPIHRKTFLKNI